MLIDSQGFNLFFNRILQIIGHLKGEKNIKLFFTGYRKYTAVGAKGALKSHNVIPTARPA